MEIKKFKKFDDNFLWGASISAFQAEGASTKDGKGLSIQDVKKISEKYSDFSVAADFYNNYKEDIALLKEMGLSSFRFSISWTRIIPDGDGEINKKGITFYHNLIDELKKNGIEPIVTIYHFDLPYLLQQKGGWSNRDMIVKAFLKYSKVLFNEYAKKVKYWLTINEQNVMIMIGSKMKFLNGEDKKFNEKELYNQSHNMFIAQALVMEELHNNFPDCLIAPALNIVSIYPNSNKPQDYLAAMNASVMRNWYYLDAIVRGEYNPIMYKYLEDNNFLPDFRKGDYEILKKAKPDFIAFNYYTSATVKSEVNNFVEVEELIDQQRLFDVPGMFSYCENPNLEKTEYGWDIDSTGFRITMREMYERYRLPLMITENGLGYSEELNENNTVDDSYRIEYYEKHLNELRKCISEGIKVISYNAWTAIDIVSSHQGFSKRYGFIYVDRTEKDLKQMKRYPKKSFYWYKEYIKKLKD
ncbi:6-phospho-beta-glucosidase [Mesoplasma coleopterae]|uniref:glycoside hydrolase family 1 protein n=1 Tax=Mesoplasma coleopterae TaxID=324078 RepID=UPI000D03655B|nr:glycoside hydrolase family 1 protein [Mesoplasma coleopterae]AVN62343.1 6-phospho-beta-glucosidase [Mesoplasma coleopterae]